MKEHKVVAFQMPDGVEDPLTELLRRGADEIVIAPCHPYTEALVSAVPIPDPHAHRSRIILKGDIPSPIDPPAGFRFHTRCPHARAQCAVEQTQLREVRTGHWAACHFAEQIYGAA